MRLFSVQGWIILSVKYLQSCQQLLFHTNLVILTMKRSEAPPAACFDNCRLVWKLLRTSPTCRTTRSLSVYWDTGKPDILSAKTYNTKTESRHAWCKYVRAPSIKLNAKQMLQTKSNITSIFKKLWHTLYGFGTEENFLDLIYVYHYEIFCSKTRNCLDHCLITPVYRVLPDGPHILPVENALQG